MKRFYRQFCNSVIKMDPSIRFVAVADEHGILLAMTERKGLKPLLNVEETQQYAITAATRLYTRIRWQTVLGKINYTCSHYDKLLRATVPLTDRNNHLSHVIMFTFDVKTANFHEIIMKKIIPLINRTSNQFVRGS